MDLASLQIISVLFLLFYSTASRATIQDEDIVYPIYRFSTEHKVENLAVRGNGKVLVTIAVPAPQLWQFDPFNASAPVLVKEFSGVNGSLGITELGEDKFYVATGNFTLDPYYTGLVDSFYIYEVDMATFRATPNGIIIKPANIRQAAHVTQASLLNGVASLQNSSCATAKNSVLVADTGASAVWSINIDTGTVTLAAQDATMEAPPNSSHPIGVNGIKVRENYLYYTNTARKELYRLPLDVQTGLVPANATAELLLQNLDCDDFTFDADGLVYVAGPSNIIQLGDPRTGSVSVIAGTAGSNQSSIVGPISVALGRAVGSGQLFIATNGGADMPIVADQGLSRMYTGDTAQL